MTISNQNEIFDIMSPKGGDFISKYHINRNGKVVRCNAKKRPCPLGTNFSSVEEANVFLEKNNLQDNKPTEISELTNKSENTKDLQSEKENKLLTSSQLANKSREDLLIQLNEEQEKIKDLKGIKRIKALKNLRRVEYALEGRNYDAEVEEERKIREESIKKAEELAMQSKVNAEKIAKKESIPLPESITQYIVNKPWARTKVSAFRGEQTKNAKTNTGLAMYGQGRYTTTDKSYAKKYGVVREASLEELPTLPLRLRTVGAFELLEQEVAREHKISKADLYLKMDISDMIKKMGYDGLTLGTGKDMIIVKYY